MWGVSDSVVALLLSGEDITTWTGRFPYNLKKCLKWLITWIVLPLDSSSTVNAQLSRLAVAIQIKCFLSACFAEYYPWPHLISQPPALLSMAATSVILLSRPTISSFPVTANFSMPTLLVSASVLSSNLWISTSYPQRKSDILILTHPTITRCCDIFVLSLKWLTNSVSMPPIKAQVAPCCKHTVCCACM